MNRRDVEYLLVYELNARYEKELAKKREEKGLVTVLESVNETDPNRTQAPGVRDSHTPHSGDVKNNKTRYQAKEGTVIQEDDERDYPEDRILEEDDQDKGQFGTISHSVKET